MIHCIILMWCSIRSMFLTPIRNRLIYQQKEMKVFKFMIILLMFLIFKTKKSYGFYHSSKPNLVFFFSTLLVKTIINAMLKLINSSVKHKIIFDDYFRE